MKKVKATIIIRSIKNIKVYTRDISGEVVMERFTSLKKSYGFVKKILEVKK